MGKQIQPIFINSSIRLPEFESFNFKELRKKTNLTLRQVEEYSGISNARLLAKFQ